jgi:hypothetical protein
MLSSLLQRLKNALRRLVPAQRPAAVETPRTEPALDSTRPDSRSLVGGFEMDYWRDSPQGLQSQRLWVRVDTRELMARLCNNPDINLDALSDEGPPTQPDFEPSDWHRKVRHVIRTPPPPTRH